MHHAATHLLVVVGHTAACVMRVAPATHRHQLQRNLACSGGCIGVGSMVDQVFYLRRTAPDGGAVQGGGAVEQRRNHVAVDQPNLR